MPTFEVKMQGGPPRLPGGGLVPYVPGIVLCALGLCILLMPDLLRYLIAAFFLGIGVLLLVGASSLRAMRGPRPLGDLFDRFRPPPSR